MQSFKFVCLVAVFSVYKLSAQEVNDTEVDKLINSSKANIAKYEGQAELVELVGVAKKNNAVISKEYVDELHERKSLPETVFENSQGDSDETLWNTLAQASQQQSLLTKKQERYGGVKTYILVSLSMPVTSLETLFTEVGYLKNKSDIVFVFQGWPAPNFNAFLAKVDKLMPLDHEPNVVVDPTIFKTLEVNEVPFFAIKTEDKGWKKVLGDVSLSRAINEANSHYDRFTPIGPIYPIIEPNMLDYIYKKIEETNWEEAISKATNKLIDKQPSRVDLPLSNDSYQYFVDGTVTINEDVSVKGESIVEPGHKVNPLDHISLSKAYAIIDVSSSAQLDIVRYWKKSHRNVKVITTVLPSFKEKHALEGEFGTIHQLDPMLAKRFGLEKVPSIVYQKGNGLIVEVVKHDVDLSEVLSE